MRHFFASKDHKKNKSLKLQQKLQSEEDKLWQDEQARRRWQELRDNEVARIIQEQLESEEQQQSSSPSESDEALARRLQQEFERANMPYRHSSPRSPVAAFSSTQILSDEEYARRLQEELNAETENVPMIPPTAAQQLSEVSPIPPPLPVKPTAYHTTQYLATTSPAVSTSMSSGPLGSRSGSSVPDASRYHLTSPPSSTLSYSNIHSDCVPASNINNSRTRRDGSRISLSNGRPTLAISIPPLYTASHPPQTTSTPDNTTTPAAFAPSTQSTTSNSDQIIHVHSAVRDVNAAPVPVPKTVPSASRVSYAQVSSLSQYSPYPPPASGAYLPQQKPEQQQHDQVVYNSTGHPSLVGRGPEQGHNYGPQTVGSRLFSGWQNENNVKAFLPATTLLQYNENNSTQHQPVSILHEKRGDIPASMPIPEALPVVIADRATPYSSDINISASAAPNADLQVLSPSHPKTSLLRNNATIPLQRKETPRKSHGAANPHPIGILKTGHKPDEEPPQDTATRYNHCRLSDSDDDFSEDFFVLRQDTPIKEKTVVHKGEELESSNGSGLDPFADSHAVENTQSSEDEYAKDRVADVISTGVSRGTLNSATAFSAIAKSSWAAYPTFNSVNYLDDDDLVNLDTSGSGSSEYDGSSEDNSVVLVSSKRRPRLKIGVTVAIQTDPIEDVSSTSVMDNKVPIKSVQEQQDHLSTATRVDPTFGNAIKPRPMKRAESMQSQSMDDEARLASAPTPLIGDMQTRLEGLLVDVSTESLIHDKVDKIQSTQEPQILHMQGAGSGWMGMQHHHSYSISSLASPTGTGQLQQQHLYLPAPHAAMAPATYHETLYTSTQPMYFHSSQHSLNMLSPGLTPEPPYAGEVPRNEYGYYSVGISAEGGEPHRQGNPNPAAEKVLPEIPKYANRRHITIPSIDPTQRVWIRVHPTDTGKDLAQRIHIVATYRTRKILSIKTAQGRDIPLDGTFVFDDWSEIEELEDGVPWEVEWGPMDDPFSGGRQLLKHIAANLRAAVMD